MQNRQRNNYLIATALLLSIIAIPMLIFSSFSFGIVWRLSCALFLGFIIGVIFFPKIYLEFRNIKTVEIIAVIISILGLVSTIYVYLNTKALDNIFDSQELYKIDELFKLQEDPHYIFGFDITEYSDSPTIDDNDYLLTFYNIYSDEVRKYKEILYPTKRIKYKEFCRVKLCADLMRLKNKPGKFSIYLIGKEIKTLIHDRDFSEENIRWAIEEIFKNHDIDTTETHLEKYYETVYNAVKNQKKDLYSFVKYVVFTYSDFVLDKKNNSIITEEIDIKTLREGKQQTKGLNQFSVIENLYILPHIDKNKNKATCILAGDGNLYERRTYVSRDIIEGEANGNSVLNLRYYDIPIYYSKNENSSPNLYFSDSLYQIKLFNQKEYLTDIKLIDITNNINYQLNNTTYETIRSKGLYKIKFKGSDASTPIIIDVLREDLHVFLELKVVKNQIDNNFLRFLIIVLLILFGVCIPYAIGKIFRFSKN
jgi:hypothetical protein